MTRPLRPPKCDHCGGPVPSGERFCCSGCAAVYAALHDAGLGDWYALRSRDPQALLGAPPPADRDRDFGYLDTEACRAAHAAAAGDRESWRLAIGGMSCVACAWLIEKVAREHEGVRRAEVDFTRRELRLVTERGRPIAPLGESLAGFGYALGLPGEDPGRGQRREVADVAVAGALGANAMLMAIPGYAGLASGGFLVAFSWIGAALATLSLAGPGRSLVSRSWHALREARPDLDLPIGVGLVAAWSLSTWRLLGGRHDGLYFDSLAVLVFTLRAGRYLRRAAVDRALAATGNLASGLPERIAAWRGGRYARIAPEELAPGDRVRAEPGQRLPVPTRLLAAADIDLAVVSGESRPRGMEAGEELPAGARAVSEAVELEVLEGPRSAGGAEPDPGVGATTDGALERRLGRAFTAVVGVVALASAAWWGGQADAERAVMVAMSVLIVACPCALALAGPIVIARTLSGCAREGVLIRDPGVIERLSSVRVALLDKTGTLTAGEPRVVARLWTVRGRPRERIAAAAAAVESAARHPVARAITLELQGLAGDSEPAVVRDVRGGVEGGSAGVEVAVLGVTAATARRLAAEPELTDFVSRHGAAGETIACVAHGGRIVAAFALRDPLRPGVERALATLSAHGISAALLSGDREAAVRELAAVIGLDEAISDATPADKERAVRQRGPGVTMMVGDGFNDLPALRRAAVAVTLRSAPAAAIEAAHVVLASTGLPGIAALLERAARARRASRAATGWALLYNGAGMALAASGTITPLLAAVLMPLSSLTVVLVATAWTGDRGGAGLASREQSPRS